ncbi:hypothetical protein NDU88_000515 [Pleurodeles waltl]|uniref:Uncharacterized protein n=1 Tax=Pleurodeles waltl TaxID=8319 RepID=A0AAV7LXM5_PLEWA|nr:hypothetical protein NDU88_000515 [Pleurodeles waltl]
MRIYLVEHRLVQEGLLNLLVLKISGIQEDSQVFREQLQIYSMNHGHQVNTFSGENKDPIKTEVDGVGVNGVVDCIVFTVSSVVNNGVEIAVNCVIIAGKITVDGAVPIVIGIGVDDPDGLVLMASTDLPSMATLPSADGFIDDGFTDAAVD